MTKSDSFFKASGSSPPASAPTVSREGPPALPCQLVEELAEILADALAADLERYPNLEDIPKFSEIKGIPAPTVESPSGHDRRTSRSRDQAATDLPAPPLHRRRKAGPPAKLTADATPWARA